MADILPEKWMKAMAVTTTALAVVASIASSRASFFISQAQFLTALEEDQWSYYQAKSIKQDLFETKVKLLQVKLLGASVPGQRELLNQDIQAFTNEIARYEQEKMDIKKKAESVNQQNAIDVKRGSQFSLAIVFAQIAILLSSIGVLLKRRELWSAGLVMGAISLFFIANGFLLFFKN